MLIDSHFIAQDDFLALAEELSDSQLKDLANVVEGMQTPPKLDHFPALELYGYVAAKTFVTTLTQMDEGTRGRVLEQASLHAAKVPNNNNPDTYQPHGMGVFNQGSTAANDLHNFVSSVNKHSDVNVMLDKLGAFSDQQQSDLLYILGNSQELGDKLMDQLITRDSATQDSMLSMLSQLSQSATGFVPDIKHVDGAYAILGHDNQSARVVWNMIEDSINLMSNYQFSDDQIKDMSDSMQALERGHQRAYLEVTKVGLEQMLGTGEKGPIDLEGKTAELEALKDLRNSHAVLDTVYKARMGERRVVDGEFHYEHKDDGVGERDQKELIEVLVANAWLTNTEDQDSSHTKPSNLDLSISRLGAKKRDELVDKLNKLIDRQRPLNERDVQAVHDSHEQFKTQVDTIVNSSDVDSLLEAEADTPPEQQPAFWQAGKLAGKEVDKLVDLLEISDADSRQQIIQDLATASTLVDKGEMSEKEGAEYVEAVLSLLPE